jgi:hypothetical protein
MCRSGAVVAGAIVAVRRCAQRALALGFTAFLRRSGVPVAIGRFDHDDAVKHRQCAVKASSRGC